MRRDGRWRAAVCEPEIPGGCEGDLAAGLRGSRMRGNMKRERYKTSILLVLALALVGILCYRAGRADGAGSGVPGSVSDPLITKSYLEERLSQVGGGRAAYFSKVTLARGEQLTLYAGSELMLYAGSAAVVGADGLVNLTTGELFKRGNSVVRYHLYLAPEDGCGISADGSVTVYVRGDYNKKN